MIKYAVEFEDGSGWKRTDQESWCDSMIEAEILCLSNFYYRFPTRVVPVEENMDNATDNFLNNRAGEAERTRLAVQELCTASREIVKVYNADTVMRLMAALTRVECYTWS